MHYVGPQRSLCRPVSCLGVAEGGGAKPKNCGLSPACHRHVAPRAYDQRSAKSCLDPPGKMAMKLAGDLAEFSLADLVQVAGVARRTCAVRVLAADGNGTPYLHGGEVVSAVFEDLSGFDAFVALVAAHAGHFQVENGAQPERR